MTRARAGRAEAPAQRRPVPGVGSLALARGERVAAALVTGLLVAVHVGVMLSAGPLWRDEINMVNTARTPTLPQMWAGLEFEAFPALWPALLRLWAAAGLGDGDRELRVAGFAAGLAALGALWWHARITSRSVPLLSLVLLAINPTTIRWGDSLRAFGLGTALVIVTAALAWRLAERPTRGRAAAATVAALLATHALYHNAVILLGLGAGAAALGALRRDWRPPAVAGALGGLCALSLLPYRAPLGAALAWNAVLQSPVDVSRILAQAREAMAAAGTFAGWTWALSAVAGLGACAAAFVAAGSRAGALDRERAAFLGTSMIVAAVGYVAFLLTVGYATQVWYYLPIMGFLAASLDAAIHPGAAALRPARAARLALVVLGTMLAAHPAWSAARQRQTNVDLVAERLAALAAPDDLIVVNTWEVGLTFLRYHRGPTPWTTIPEIEDHRVHRYDVLRARMTEAAPIAPLLERVAQTLRSGHRVWLVGGLPFLQPGERVEVLPPAPRGPAGWAAAPYVTSWGMQVAALLQQRAQGLEEVAVPAGRPVNPFEDVALVVARGWR
jgi:hypothetical protein